MKTLKICLVILCLLPVLAIGMPQFRGATFYMKEIKLTRGLVAFVDDEDFEWLNQWKWYANKSYTTDMWYAERTQTINSKKTNIRMHRLILNVSDRKILVDHKDRNGLNNKKCNLRVCTPSQNQGNRTKTKGNVTSKFRGVSWYKEKKRWRASIMHNRKTYIIGKFKTEIEAAKAYNNMAIKMYGEFANLNQV